MIDDPISNRVRAQEKGERIAEETLARIARELDKQNSSGAWSKLPPPPPSPTCDLCDRRAVWKHPAGGLRCGRCPRPEK